VIDATAPSASTLQPAHHGASEVAVRRALPADGPARCALMARVAMETDLSLSVRRDPDVDALYRLQSPDWESWVVDADGAVEGMGTALVRDGYLNGARTRIGYLGDLRFSPKAEGRLLLDRFYGPVLRSASARFGCDYFLTAVIASNTRALRALTARTRRADRCGRPRYTLLREFDIRSIHLVLPLPPRLPRLSGVRRGAGVRVRAAIADDVPAIARCLDDDARRRPFGYVLDEGALRRRLASWPGLSASSFHVAEDGAGRIVGCLARWDAAPVKRTAVVAYRGAMRRVRRAHDAVARLLGRPTLPAPGGEFRYQYLTHVAVPSDDPATLRALLRAAYAGARADGCHFMSAFAPESDPLAPAYRGYVATNLRAHLYLVTLPEVPLPALGPDARPAFEMALV